MERLIHKDLDQYKAEEAGGVEWFQCPSIKALRTVREVILNERLELENQSSLERLNESISTFERHVKNDKDVLESSRRMGFSGGTVDFCRGKLARSEEILQEVYDMIQSVKQANFGS